MLGSSDYSVRCPIVLSRRRAVFSYGMGTPISAITDGTSNTIAVAEYLKGIGPLDARGNLFSHRAAWQMLYVTLSPNSATPDNIYGSTCNSSNVPLQTVDEPDINLPCIGVYNNNANFVSPRSRHPGGVNAVFCDGSVHFISDGINSYAPPLSGAGSTNPPGTWQRLGWMADGYNPGEY